MGANTDLVRAGLARTPFNETAEALFLTSGCVYPTAQEAEAAFAGETDRFIYSRYGNPTVATFEERLRVIEGAEAAWATASGMSAGLQCAGGHRRDRRSHRCKSGAVRIVLHRSR